MIIGGVDLETTGLMEPEHRIIECCIIKYEWDGVTAKHLSSKTWRINPQRSIDAKAQKVHKISEADLIGSPTFSGVASEIAEELDGCDVVCAHNGLSFDFPFLAKELERVRCDLPDFEIFDTMTSGRWATGMGEVPSLQALCYACGVIYQEDLAHAAEYDVEKMLDCLFYGLRRKVYTLPI